MHEVNSGPMTAIDYTMLSRDIMQAGGNWDCDYRELLEIMDEAAPVIGYFTLNEAPPGDFPEAFRQAWVGIALPVRVMNCRVGNRLGVVVNSREAQEIFLANAPTEVQTMAQEHWQSYYQQRMIKQGIVKDDFDDQRLEYIFEHYHLENVDFMLLDYKFCSFEALDVPIFNAYDNIN